MYLQYIEELKNGPELAYIWLTLLTNLLKLLGNAQKAKRLEFIEVTVENIKNIIKVMINLGIMGKVIIYEKYI